jgi:hypothetical protein
MATNRRRFKRIARRQIRRAVRRGLAQRYAPGVFVTSGMAPHGLLPPVYRRPV